MYRHIMLPFNGSDRSLRAEKECIALARSIGARVTVIQVIGHRKLLLEDARSTELVKELEEEYDIEAKRSAWNMLEEVEQRAKASGVECSSVVVLGNEPYKEIINSAVARRCDLVMMASGRRRILPVFASAGDTGRVLSHSPVPVLVVR